MSRRLLDLLLRLFPARFRERHARQVRELVEETLRREEDPARRKAHLRRATLDTLRTLPRAWADLPLGRTGTGSGALGSLPRDLAFTWRYLRRRPLRTVTLVATLAFALGSATAIASVAHAVLLRALPYADAERIVQLVPSAGRFTTSGFVVDPAVLGYPEVERATVYTPDGAGAIRADPDAPARRISVTQVSSTFFETLGVSLALGGGFGPRTGDVDRIVLSYDLWRSDFGADPDLLGTQVYLTERPLTVVGVAPPDVDFPGGTQAWLPMPTWGDLYGTASGSEVLARVRSPADMEPLRARLQQRVDAQWADVPERIPPVAEVRPMRAVLAGGLVTPLALLGGGAALVLVLACLNLAGIELAGMSQRTRELRVRRALGASRTRMVAQLLTESLALAVLAGAGGIALAAIAIPLLGGLLPAGAHGVDAAGLDPVVLGFAALLTVVTGLAVGVLPAMRASRRGGLGTGGGVSESLEGRRLQRTLVVLQIGVAVVLAGGAGLLGRSMAARLDTDLGYDVEQVFTFRVRVPTARADDRPAYLRAVRERLEGLPGVVAVGASTALPLSAGSIAGWQIQRAGREEPRIGASRVEATDGFLDAMGIPILEGIDVPAPFASEDGIVVTRSVVDTLFGAEPALGQLVQLGGARGMGDPQPIVGIIDDLRLYGEEVGGRAAVLASYRHQIEFGFAVRTTGDPSALAPAVRGILGEVDPGIPPFEMRTTASALAQHRAARSAVARLTGLFGSVALILASFGLYGLIARTILTRRRELGVRIALGASPRALVRRTVVSGMGLALLGIGLGIAAFLPLAGRLDPMLFQVDPREPTVLGPVVLVVLAVTVLATWIPARATLRLEPRDALRAEP